MLRFLNQITPKPQPAKSVPVRRVTKRLHTARLKENSVDLRANLSTLRKSRVTIADNTNWRGSDRAALPSFLPVVFQTIRHGH
jgi:hypothetical protein